MTEIPSIQSLQLGMVAWRALPAALPHLGKRVGGLETGAWTLATGLGQFTNIVPHFFVHSTTQRIPKHVNHVQLCLDYEPLAGVREDFSRSIDLGPPLKIHRLPLRLLWQFPLLALARGSKKTLSDPTEPDPRLMDYQFDAWAGFGVNADSARVVATALHARVPSLLFLESNADLDARIAAGEEFVNAYGESSHSQRFAIDNATSIVCQSRHQQQELQGRFQRKGVLLRNPIDRKSWFPKETTPRTHVLWIGRFDTFHKRLPLALEIAQQLPELRFRMIVNPHDSELETQIRKAIPQNVELVDYVPFDQMPHEFAQARAFLCTGSPVHEGFPNVLLQSAASHTPICSLSDFDDFLVDSGAGLDCKESIEKAVEFLRQFARSPSPWQPEHTWKQVDDYLEERHSLRSISLETSLLLQQLLTTDS